MVGLRWPWRAATVLAYTEWGSRIKLGWKGDRPVSRQPGWTKLGAIVSLPGWDGCISLMDLAGSAVHGLGSGRPASCSVRSAEDISARQAISRVGWLCSQCARSWAVCCAACNSQLPARAIHLPWLCSLPVCRPGACVACWACSEATGHCTMSRLRSDQGCCRNPAPALFDSDAGCNRSLCRCHMWTKSEAAAQVAEKLPEV